jgi:cytochrome c553
MFRTSLAALFLPIALATTPSAAPDAAATQGTSSGLVFDAVEKDYAAGAGEKQVTFSFTVKNPGPAEIVVGHVRTSCGCSVANLPRQPWPLGAGESGKFQIVVDLRGKRGVLVKSATVETNAGAQQLRFRITIPEPDPREEMRERNLLIAQGDRQAVFRGECAPCHVEPAKNKTGRDLYVAACAICHAEDGHRASMVPDLRKLSPAPTAETWRHLITHGKPGTLMPAFALPQAGPLTEAQIESLVEYLTDAFRAEEKPAGH